MSTSVDSRGLLHSAAIRAWVEVSDSGVLGRLNVTEALTWARERWTGEPPSGLGGIDIDRLHALVRVMREDAEAAPSRVAAWHHALERTDWPTDLFDEKLELLCQLSYIAWRQFRRTRAHAAAWIWEQKVVTLTLLLPSVPEFISLPEVQRTEQIRRRFFSDPTVLLTLCRRLADLTSSVPSEALRQAESAYRFLSSKQVGSASSDEYAYLLANFALVAAVAQKELGSYEQSARWLTQAEKLCRSASGSEITQARIDFVRKALAYQMRRYQEALDGASELKERFIRFEVPRYVARCSFLEGLALKELGRDHEALRRLVDVASSASAEVETWFRGLALIHAAEIHGRNGQDLSALDALQQAWVLVRDTDAVGTIAHFHGVKGEILRDRGRLAEAIPSYRLAVAAYASAGMMAFEAYVRILLAETLLVAGEDRDALLEILKALPIIESLGLVREGVAAVALLRESLSRQKADHQALVTLKRELKELSQKS